MPESKEDAVKRRIRSLHMTMAEMLAQGDPSWLDWADQQLFEQATALIGQIAERPLKTK